MSRPVNDFVKGYAESETVRLHMPGHKGVGELGIEKQDITEIKGADYLYAADGIIGQSEKQMTAAFGSRRTLYSTEGSSQCIKAMLGIIKLAADGKRVTVLAARNVHKAFIDACILLDLDIVWLYPKTASGSICCADITAELVEQALDGGSDIGCCYITSPDYIGNISDIRDISKVCRQHGVPLLVDNAHGSYLRFLSEDTHPITLGADMCCDSAHKTLPCLTGGALLHISDSAPELYSECAKNVMSMFGSTSPSYLILQSLDYCSDLLSSGVFSKKLAHTADACESCKQKLISLGWKLCGGEKLKISLSAADCGYDGNELADLLRERGIEPEYSDKAFVVLMVGVNNTQADLDRLTEALHDIPVLDAKQTKLVPITPTKRVLSVREAAFRKYTTVSVGEAVGQVCAMTVTACQPSVPVAVSGELITREIAQLLVDCGVSSVNVISSL